MNTTAKILTVITVLVMAAIPARAIQVDDLLFFNQLHKKALPVCTTDLRPARDVGGTVMAVVDLPVVTIEAYKVVPGKYVTIQKNGERIATVDLPQVEVTAPINCAHMYPAVQGADGLLASVMLPEVVITWKSTPELLAEADDTREHGSFWRAASRLPVIGIYILVAYMYQ